MTRLYEVYLLRHGESTANAQGLFTGVLNPPLTERGRIEARDAGLLLQAAGIRPVSIFASALERTIATALIVKDVLGLDADLRIEWRLNERNYGALTGQSKTAVARRYGVSQFLTWRRSFLTAPPPMSAEQLEAIRSEEPFRSLPQAALTPTESLHDVGRRILPFVAEQLYHALVEESPVIVVGHGNSLRALCMIIEGLTPRQVEQLAIPTGQPLRYRFDLRSGTPALVARDYLDPDAAVEATELLNRQGGT
ncbi:2,3-bisphosphoglycerate-dependent phosphoglycerate mutase [Leifsonia shinshuensis]|uniref:2,3-bisphosphoglycerate-dependent phosphoglycerate mutase n=1 Tax=Leifsonia shinshuensis TaxID=150026 RepID=UPI0016242753|nr:2,3-diphosphoglycerate-dependent phosphoglycerate mutase [Leifsonia shinshuensis]